LIPVSHRDGRLDGGGGEGGENAVAKSMESAS
jgi:hypothetical protein